MLEYRETTLQELLDAREKRAEHQREMLARHGNPLICFTMNMAGPLKVDNDTQFAFSHGVTRLKEALRLSGLQIAEEKDFSSPAGHEIMMAVDGDPLRLKRLCAGIEETDAMGRLYDLDVLTPDGEKVSRQAIGLADRCCIVCGAGGKGCASRRIHSAEEVRQKENKIIREARLQLLSDRIASLAVKALLIEVGVSPKPGLVDRFDSGSHQDMDIFTFFAGISSLQPYFASCFRLGADHEMGHFFLLRSVGLEAESTMYRATDGVNTHRGAIFMMGILCYTAGMLGGELTMAKWQAACADFCSRGEEEPAVPSHGEKMRKAYGASGARGEACTGFPSVFEIGVPALLRAQDSSLNDACLYALLVLIASVRDTNMLFRGGREAAESARLEVQKLLREAAGALPSRDALASLNASFIARRLSPGGCADLLSASVFVLEWQKETERWCNDEKTSPTI